MTDLLGWILIRRVMNPGVSRSPSSQMAHFVCICGSKPISCIKETRRRVGGAAGIPGQSGLCLNEITKESTVLRGLDPFIYKCLGSKHISFAIQSVSHSRIYERHFSMNFSNRVRRAIVPVNVWVWAHLSSSCGALHVRTPESDALPDRSR